MDLWKWHCQNRREKNFVTVGLWQSHCRNRGIKFVAIVAMPLPKMGEKKNSGCRNLWRNLKKKSATSIIFLQQITGD